MLSLQLFGKPTGLSSDRDKEFTQQSIITAVCHRLKCNENKSTNDWAEATPYAGVRVIIRTPMYFFLAAVLPGDGRQTTQTQSVSRSPRTLQAFSLYECLSGIKKKNSFGGFYPPPYVNRTSIASDQALDLPF